MWRTRKALSTIPAAALAAIWPAVALAAMTTEALPLPDPPRYDELVCYRVKDPQRLEARARFLPSQSPPFPVPPGCKARLTARELCVPAAAKFGSVVPGDPDEIEPAIVADELRHDYLCYAIRCPNRDLPESLAVADRFGARRLGLVRPARICVTARKVSKPRCCDPFEEPGAQGHPACLHGATCCADGTWACNDATGESTCDVDGRVCERCCDPHERPGQGRVPACIEGATCCADGRWRCNDAQGGSTCGAGGIVCNGTCCDPTRRPGTHGIPACIEGASCCADGRWACNDAEGRSTCEAPGAPCRRVCGGIAGLVCEPDEICLLDEGRCCCDFEGVCRVRPDACPEVFDPVCGCDRLTYSNECDAHAHGVNVDHRGPCSNGVGELP